MSEQFGPPPRRRAIAREREARSATTTNGSPGRVDGGLWEERWDPVAGKTFFRNRLTGFCRWQLERKADKLKHESDIEQARRARDALLARAAARVEQELVDEVRVIRGALGGGACG